MKIYEFYLVPLTVKQESSVSCAGGGCNSLKVLLAVCISLGSTFNSQVQLALYMCSYKSSEELYPPQKTSRKGSLEIEWITGWSSVTQICLFPNSEVTKFKKTTKFQHCCSLLHCHVIIPRELRVTCITFNLTDVSGGKYNCVIYSKCLEKFGLNQKTF